MDKFQRPVLIKFRNVITSTAYTMVPAGPPLPCGCNLVHIPVLIDSIVPKHRSLEIPSVCPSLRSDSDGLAYGFRRVVRVTGVRKSTVKLPTKAPPLRFAPGLRFGRQLDLRISHSLHLANSSESWPNRRNLSSGWPNARNFFSTTHTSVRRTAYSIE